MRLVVSGTSVPKFVLKLAQYFVHYVLGDTKFADILCRYKQLCHTCH